MFYGRQIHLFLKLLSMNTILIDFILYVPVNNFSVMSRRVFLGEPVLSKDKRVLLKDATQ